MHRDPAASAARPTIGPRRSDPMSETGPAADIHENRADAKSLTLNVDAPTQGAVNLTALFIGNRC